MYVMWNEVIEMSGMLVDKRGKQVTGRGQGRRPGTLRPLNLPWPLDPSLRPGFPTDASRYPELMSSPLRDLPLWVISSGPPALSGVYAILPSCGAEGFREACNVQPYTQEGARSCI